MPGAYAHITLVNIAKETRRLDAVPGFPTAAKAAIQRHFKFCELGAVSPDYPYLAVTDSKAKAWADLMHYKKNGDLVKQGVELVRAMPAEQRGKAFVWLAGFTAHVVADVTIHPVVELKVGDYAKNKTAHSICEMHQDAYIFDRLNLGPLGLSEHLDSGIWACCSAPNSGIVDPAVSGLWSRMLETCHPSTFKENTPNIDQWHKAFRLMVDKIGEEGNKLLPLARHIAVDCGLTYPAKKDIESQYIKALKTPQGTMDYDAIFDKAINNVIGIWRSIAGGIFNGENAYQSAIGNWNLDTGRDENNKLIFWDKS